MSHWINSEIHWHSCYIQPFISGLNHGNPTAQMPFSPSTYYPMYGIGNINSMPGLMLPHASPNTMGIPMVSQSNLADNHGKSLTANVIAATQHTDINQAGKPSYACRWILGLGVYLQGSHCIFFASGNDQRRHPGWASKDQTRYCRNKNLCMETVRWGYVGMHSKHDLCWMLSPYTHIAGGGTNHDAWSSGDYKKWSPSFYTPRSSCRGYATTCQQAWKGVTQSRLDRQDAGAHQHRVPCHCNWADHAK